MRIGASKLHGPPHTATAPGTSLLLSQQPLPVARGRPPCRCFCRGPCSPTVRVLLHMPRGCAPRAAPALLHAGRCARRRLLPCARRTRLSRPPCALHRLRRHRRMPPLRFLPTPRRPVDPASAAEATTQRLAAHARDYILVAGGNRWTDGLVGGVDGLVRLVGGY